MAILLRSGAKALTLWFLRANVLCNLAGNVQRRGAILGLRMSVEPHALAGQFAGDEAGDRLLARVVFEASWERDLDRDLLRWTSAKDPVFGYSRAEVPDDEKWWRERIHPDDRLRVDQSEDDAVRSGVSSWSIDYRFRRKDGSWA